MTPRAGAYWSRNPNLDHNIPQQASRAGAYCSENSAPSLRRLRVHARDRCEPRRKPFRAGTDLLRDSFRLGLVSF